MVLWNVCLLCKYTLFIYNLQGFLKKCFTLYLSPWVVFCQLLELLLPDKPKFQLQVQR